MQIDDGDNDELSLPDDFSHPRNLEPCFLCVSIWRHIPSVLKSFSMVIKVLENGQALCGSNITTFDEELQAVKDFESHNWDLLKR